MRLATLKPNDLALVRDEMFIPIGGSLAEAGALSPGASMIDLITRYESIKGAIGAAANRGAASAIDPKRLGPPVPRPSKIWAAAGNYRRGGTGLDNTSGRGATATATPAELLESAFLKPPSAVIGPEDYVVIPEGVDGVFPELELCVVIGQESRNLSRDQALDAVFGYTIILDMTARSSTPSPSGIIGSRCVRKGYETFAPIGPWITTRDEIADPQALFMRLWVNGELRQAATTDAMINGVVDLVTYLSRVGTLLPGDLIATGNPDSPGYQQSLAPGDTLKAEFEHIGTMSLYVRGPSA